MPKIHKLDQHVADLIAAGEVVERPASVVKELLENAIDSGAGTITVEIENGGMKYIRVTDNGSGIAPNEAETAFLRHATSKLRDARGLEAIGTLGFRGEALAAIAAVSRVELQTREALNDEGVALELEAGKVTKKSPVGCPVGTTIIVKDLFFNTPARLKFMKSDRAEASAIAALVTRIALSKPDISFRLIKDKKQEYLTPGDSRVDSSIYALLGREMEAGFIPANQKDENISIKGYISKPSAARGNRGYQFFFVNGRVIKSQLLQAAIEQAYRNILSAGRFPACVLHIETGLNSVDVNVHPSKTEIKFVTDKTFFDGVYYATLGALEKYKHSQTSAVAAVQTNNRNYLGTPQSSVQASQFNNTNPEKAFKAIGVEEYQKTYKESTSYRNPPRQTTAKAHVSSIAYNTNSNQNQNIKPVVESSHFTQVEIGESNISTIAPTTPSLLETDSYRVIGETMSMYIIVEQGASLLFIDKHAAHERIHFDALREKTYKPMSEALFSPVVCRMGHEETAILLESVELLEDLGFVVEELSQDSVVVSYIPSEIDLADTESTLTEICDKMKQSAETKSDKMDSIFKIIACKAAIKAGKSSDKAELEKLAEKVMYGEVTHCPHGRPIVYKLSKTTLDKNLGRI